MTTRPLNAEGLPAEDAAEEAASAPEADLAAPAEADASENEEDDGEEDGEPDDGELFYYYVTMKNGAQSFHEDDRDPADMAFEYKVALGFPATAESYLTDEELKWLEERKSEDGVRYRKNGQQFYLFEIGEAVFDPREIATFGLVEELICDPSKAKRQDDGGDPVVAAPQAPPPAPAPTPAPRPERPAPAPVKPTGGRLQKTLAGSRR